MQYACSNGSTTKKSCVRRCSGTEDVFCGTSIQLEARILNAHRVLGLSENRYKYCTVLLVCGMRAYHIEGMLSHLIRKHLLRSDAGARTCTLVL
jgi:hypothetical protein